MFKTSTLAVTLALATEALLATGAAAQTSTAAPPQAAASDPTSDQIASWIAGNQGEVKGVDPAQDSPRVRDGQVHGVVGTSIGSGGYRSAYGVATLPIGSRGDVTVGIADEHLGGGNRGYGSPGYGYGSGGDRRTLSIGVDLTGEGLSQGPRCNGAGADQRWAPRVAPLDDPCRNRAPASQPER